MEYAKDKIFNVRYNSKLDKIEIKGEKWTSKIVKVIKRNKLLTCGIILMLIIGSINILFIMNFCSLLVTL